MRSTLSPSQVLAEHLLGRPLDQYVADKRGARPQWSWRLIAEQLTLDTDGKVRVSGEALRQWFGTPARAAEAVA